MVNLYVPRAPDTLNVARPADPVTAVASLVVPSGRVHRIAVVALATAAPPLSLTVTPPVTVTFEPSGAVSSAVVDSGPYPGTPVGGCIAGKYRGARVPAFGGSSVKVGKSFSL